MINDDDDDVVVVLATTDLDDSDEDGECNEQYDGVSGTETVGEVVVVLGPSLRSCRHHADDLVHVARRSLHITSPPDI